MRIGIVGGLDRSASDLKAVANAAGHDLCTHNGVLSGKRAVSSLRTLVARSDLVLVLTDVDSHNAVHMTRRFARTLGTSLRILRRLGSANLVAYLRSMHL